MAARNGESTAGTAELFNAVLEIDFVQKGTLPE